MNRLAGATSPYLKQHATNPVDWFPWGDEAFTRAREENKPIFLSIGYAACHWCHVMERETFAVKEIGDLLNESYISIKVDREERPDVDALYLEATMALSRMGGWPMTLFLTPEGKPFWAATYLPPKPREGLRSFTDIAETVARVWKDSREDLEKSAESLTEHLQKASSVKPVDAPLNQELLHQAFESIVSSFDWQHGGFGGAPKFPSPPILEFLLRIESRQLAETTLDNMALGGLYDLLGGGFHRYSVDDRWLIPHFEKMLYDNALLAVSYVHGWLRFGKERYRQVAEETIDYMLRELRLEGGGFASSQDADTDGKEGTTFTWTRSDGIPDEMLHIFEGGRFVFRGDLPAERRAELMAIRNARPQPARDDKAVTSWNGLALAALAECGRFLDRPDLVAAGVEVAEFLLGPLSRENGQLHRIWCEGVASGTGYLEDYADVAHGLMELHAATGELRWLEEARRIADLAIELFADSENGGFFQTPADGEKLIARKKVPDDSPTPSGSAMLAYVLLRLSRIYGDDALEEKATGVFKLTMGGMQQAPTSFGWGLVGVDFLISPRKEIAIVGPADSPVARAALGRWDPNAVIAFGPAEGIGLLEGKTLVDGKPAVYRCERFTCQSPITRPEDL